MSGLTRWHALLVVPPLLWAGNALVGRATVGMVPPLGLSFWRWALALAILLPFTGRGLWRARSVLLVNWRPVLVMGATSVGAYNTLLYLALQSSPAINATLIGASMPVMILVLSATWLREAVGARQMLGVAVSLAGVLAVIAKGEPGRLAALHLGGGEGFMVAATLAWAVYSVMLRRYPLPVGGFTLLTALILVGVVLIAPLYAAELASGRAMAAGWQAPAAVGYTALFASLAAYYFWNRGVAAVGAGTAGLYSYLIPLFTALLAVPLLGEAVQWYHAAGTALIFAGIFLATWRRHG